MQRACIGLRGKGVTLVTLFRPFINAHSLEEKNKQLFLAKVATRICVGSLGATGHDGMLVEAGIMADLEGLSFGKSSIAYKEQTACIESTC